MAEVICCMAIMTIALSGIAESTGMMHKAGHKALLARIRAGDYLSLAGEISAHGFQSVSFRHGSAKATVIERGAVSGHDFARVEMAEDGADPVEWKLWRIPGRR
ncbi:MAG: hypothetical protein LBT23_11090 [Synergistaceae bacterium]|jgi:hypothetical protein|nr:hypothetical protein [Synergistaceae bacterium]